MIIYRYLSREILLTMLAVSSTLMLIIMSGRFVKYLSEAALGRMAVDILFSIMAYQLPKFLELVLPLGFFIAILLAYGRMHMDSEMVVWSACGVSPKQLLSITAVPTVMVALLVGGMSMWVSPWGAAQTEKLLQEQKSRSEFTTMQAGYFQRFSGGKYSYVQSISHDRKRLDDIFLSQPAKAGEPPAIIVADHGKQVLNSQYGKRYLQLFKGTRYQGVPGSNKFQVTEFDMFAQHLPEPEVASGFNAKVDARSLANLWTDSNLQAVAALQWRWSMPVLVLVVGFMSVPLSRTNPRQGRYFKMLPAIVLYMLYLTALSVVRGAIGKGSFPAFPGLWSVHVVFFIIAAALFSGGAVVARLRTLLRGGRYA